ncbi:DUF1742-domain-containing protein [Sporormia fimetaria CBS 119925]|uniref:DUF1742-domain-containing protein n=1 Tax=Sporormia fimetaria CBS 119925 TaxID=1340428 RepID=A0A6A6V4L4_9PLEO|nr:DUF1742-domain-containing protein [Sporormia fimetaria CBS 119925]
MALPNTWHHRKVGDNSAKACWICYKPSTSVLITPDNKDFFYICVGHLSDRKFCQPDAEEVAAAEARKKKEELEKEIEKVKKEYEEKQKLKKEKRKEKEKDKGKDKEEKKKDEEDDKDEEKAKNEKIEELSKSKDKVQTDIGPRIYTLNKSFYQMRLDRIRNAELAKRNRERISNPSLFPSVPTNDPSKPL